MIIHYKLHSKMYFECYLSLLKHIFHFSCLCQCLYLLLRQYN
nr:MAG TPA: hypothetical protein [Bacteriophage sp.]